MRKGKQKRRKDSSDLQEEQQKHKANLERRFYTLSDLEEQNDATAPSLDLRQLNIEKLYMHGNDRIYSPMGPKIYDMYKHAKEYRSKNSGDKQSKEQSGDSNMEIVIGNGDSSSTNTVKIENFSVMKGVLQKYFGQQDAHSILIAAMEQEMGAGKKKKKKGAGENENKNKK